MLFSPSRRAENVIDPYETGMNSSGLVILKSLYWKVSYCHAVLGKLYGTLLINVLVAIRLVRIHSETVHVIRCWSFPVPKSQ